MLNAKDITILCLNFNGTESYKLEIVRFVLLDTGETFLYLIFLNLQMQVSISSPSLLSRRLMNAKVMNEATS
jgi:hypothetical protein